MVKRGNGSPRVVRNFWVDGRRSDGVEVKGTGPRGNDGSVNLNILVRDNGRVGDTSVRINCEVAGDELSITADQYVNGQRRTIQLYRGKR